jgi:alpha-tubulin suppressor-like RCC1 family protein
MDRKLLHARHRSGRLLRLAVGLSAAMTLVVSASPASAAQLSRIVEVSVGADHSCARLSDGTARCWGANPMGQLGDGTFEDRSRPVTVAFRRAPLNGIAQIEAGAEHTCALLLNGLARCWGNGLDGRLGNGSTKEQSRPVFVAEPDGTGRLAGISEIAAGEDHTCARLVDSTVLCWGANDAGQLGDGTTASHRDLPVAVTGPNGSGLLRNVAALAVGGRHSCARLVNGTVRCWGDNTYGQLGDGSRGTFRTRPVAVVSGPGSRKPLRASSISSGRDHTCAALQDRTARCWGANTSGQVGDGTTKVRPRPVRVTSPNGAGSLGRVVAIDAGEDHTCALLANRQARCWGENLFGQVGHGSIDPEHTRPVTVRNTRDTGPLEGTTGISAGGAHTCAAVAPRRARCWGANFAGQLGDATDTDSALPVAVVV